MNYYVDGTLRHVSSPEEIVLAARKSYSTDIIWERPDNGMLKGVVDSSHMVYSEDGDELYWKEEEQLVVLCFTDVFRTADGSPLPAALIEDIKEFYSGAEFSIEDDCISAVCRC